MILLNVFVCGWGGGGGAQAATLPHLHQRQPWVQGPPDHPWTWAAALPCLLDHPSYQVAESPLRGSQTGHLPPLRLPRHLQKLNLTDLGHSPPDMGVPVDHRWAAPGEGSPDGPCPRIVAPVNSEVQAEGWGQSSHYSEGGTRAQYRNQHSLDAEGAFVQAVGVRGCFLRKGRHLLSEA